MLTNLNNPAILYPARRSRTILVGVLGDTDGLKTAIATNVAAADLFLTSRLLEDADAPQPQLAIA